MRIFKRKPPAPLIPFNPDVQKPVIKCSICNGEQIAGFKNKSTGVFTEVMLIKNSDDLNSFLQMYNLSDVTKEY